MNDEKISERCHICSGPPDFIVRSAISAISDKGEALLSKAPGLSNVKTYFICINCSKIAAGAMVQEAKRSQQEKS